MDGDADMYDDDEDNNEDEMMEEDPNRKKDKQQQQQRRPGGNRLSDQVDMDDEPALVGYERYCNTTTTL
jgi:hypothetical protein